MITQLGSFVTGNAAAWLMGLTFSWLPSPFKDLVYCPSQFFFFKLLETRIFQEKKKSLQEAKAVNLKKIKGCRGLPHLLLLAFQALESRHIFPCSALNMCLADLSALVRGGSMRITFIVFNPGIHKGRTNSIKETRGLLSLLHFVCFIIFPPSLLSSCVPILHNDMGVKCELLRFDTA